jgi:hypothetical protein
MRPQRSYWFLVVLVLIFPAKIFSQQQLPRIAQNYPHTLHFWNSTVAKDLNGRYTQARILIGDGTSCVVNEKTAFTQILRPGFYTSSLPFFCKKEFQFEKNTSLPLRVRLGSLDYVNKLEGKQ